jgi:hypothetical protein
MKRLLAYELMAICFLGFTLYVIDGHFSYRDKEVVLMYAMFMVGSIGYIRPLFTKKRGRRLTDLYLHEKD